MLSGIFNKCNNSINLKKWKENNHDINITVMK